MEDKNSDVVEWIEGPYDGIGGLPPKWVPRPWLAQFTLRRAHLLLAVKEGRVEADVLRTAFSDAVRHLTTPLVTQPDGSITVEFSEAEIAVGHYWKDVQVLAHVFLAVQSGKKSGLKQLIGEDNADKVEKLDQSHKKHVKAGHTGGRATQRESEGRAAHILTLRRRLLDSGHDPREIATLISKQINKRGYSPTTIRRIIRVKAAKT